MPIEASSRCSCAPVALTSTVWSAGANGQCRSSRTRSPTPMLTCSSIRENRSPIRSSCSCQWADRVVSSAVAQAFAGAAIAVSVDVTVSSVPATAARWIKDQSAQGTGIDLASSALGRTEFPTRCTGLPRRCGCGDAPYQSKGTDEYLN